jgi:hypothetical protein
VHHILLTCLALDDLRREWRDKIQDSTTDIKKILSKPSIANPTAIFMLTTGLLKPFRYVDLEELVAEQDSAPLPEPPASVIGPGERSPNQESSG